MAKVFKQDSFFSYLNPVNPSVYGLWDYYADFHASIVSPGIHKRHWRSKEQLTELIAVIEVGHQKKVYNNPRPTIVLV